QPALRLRRGLPDPVTWRAIRAVNVLAFDTTGSACSAALLRDDALVASRQSAMERGHAQALPLMVREVMRAAGIDFAAPDLVGVTVGPGAFTGIRIGLATARGLGLAACLPVFGITTFAAVAAAANPRAQLPLVVALESRRDDLFVQRFTADG